MSDVPLIELISALVLLLLACAFFASSETSMMSLNRYRLRHLARKGHRTAKRVQKLLERPDRLLGVILIGNTLATILASSLATVIAITLWGRAGVAIVTVFLTLFMLIFSEITPKTLAVLYPQKLAFVFSLPLKFLLLMFYPIVWFGNFITNTILRLFFIKVRKKTAVDLLSAEELRTVVREAGGLLSGEDRTMLLRILELQNVTVEDIMIPRYEILGIDLEDDWEDILQLILSCHQDRMPVYQGDINNVVGILYLRNALNLFANEELNKKTLQKVMLKPYFIPEGTALGVQLINFRKEKRRCALVVDEYGEFQGLVTLEDLLEEIVGEFIVDIDAVSQDLNWQKDGSVLVDASITLRELNRSTQWDFPLKGPKTLSGLIIERLEEIPRRGVGLKIGEYFVEVVSMKGNMVRAAKVFVSGQKLEGGSVEKM